MALEKASTGQTRRHTNHVTYQQASQDRHCQAQHLLRFLLTPPYPIQAGDERKTSLDMGTNAGHCRENNHFLKLWVRCAGLSGYSMVSAPVQHTLASMPTADAGDCKCKLYEMAQQRPVETCGLSVSITDSVTSLDKLLNLSRPHFSFLKDKSSLDDSMYHIQGCCELNEIIQTNHLDYSWADIPQ